MLRGLSPEQRKAIAVNLSLRLGPNDKLVDVAGEVTQRLVLGEKMSQADRTLLGICSLVTQKISLGLVKFDSYEDKLERWEENVRAEVDKLLIDST